MNHFDGYYDVKLFWFGLRPSFRNPVNCAKLFVNVLCTPRCHTISLDVFAVLKNIVAEMKFFDNQYDSF